MPTRRSVLLGLLGAGASAALAACQGGGSSTPQAAPAGGSTSPTPGATASPRTSPSPSAGTGATTTSPTTAVPAGPDLRHSTTGAPQVALTFHGAGDPGLTRQALQTLADAGALVTVMAVGSWLESTPGLAQEILDGGHELGNHTWSHQTMPRLGADAARVEVQRCADVLDRLTGSPRRWFRPSGTPTSTATIRAAAAAAGYGACLSYDVDPRDYQDPGPSLVTSRVLASAGPGSVVSLHLGHPGTVAALPALLSGLTDKGLRPVTASTLFGIA